MNDHFDSRVPIRSGWNMILMIKGKPLTNRKISRYQKAGWYSADFRAIRRDRMNRQRNLSRREGSFLIDGERLIYSP